MGDKRYKDKHKQLGLCTNCSRPVEKGQTYCSIHRQINANKMVRLRIKRKQNNQCLVCRKPLDREYDGENYCLNCCIYSSQVYLIGRRNIT